MDIGQLDYKLPLIYSKLLLISMDIYMKLIGVYVSDTDAGTCVRVQNVQMS